MRTVVGMDVADILLIEGVEFAEPDNGPEEVLAKVDEQLRPLGLQVVRYEAHRTFWKIERLAG